jgi:hypothetical protein
MATPINAIFVNYATVFDALLISDLTKCGVHFNLALGANRTVTDLIEKQGIKCKYSPDGNRCLDDYLEYPSEKNGGYSMEKFSISNRINILGNIDVEVEDDLYSRVYAYWDDFIKENSIDLMVVKNTPHEVVEYVMYEVFRNANKKVVVLEKTYWQGVMLLITDIFKTTCLINRKDLNLDLNIANKNGMIPYWTKAKRSLYGDERNQLFNKLRSFIRLTKKGIDDKSGFLYGQYKTRDEINAFNIFQKLYLFVKIVMVKKKIIADYNSNISPLSELPQGKFIVFYLQCEPEKNISPLGGKYFDQIKAIETLRKWIPDEYALVIKEHPSQFQRWHYLEKGRYIGYYSKITELGCHLVDHQTDNKQLFQRCELNITSSGSVGLESWLMGYKSAYLGSPWYQIFSGINKISSKADLLDIINADIDQTTPKEKLAEINKYGFSGAISSFDIDSTILETDIYQSSKIIADSIVEYANS